MADRFSSLQQETNQSIADYNSRFIQLSKFASQSVVANEPSMAWEFHKVFPPEYRVHLSSHDLDMVEKVKEAALKLKTEFRTAAGTSPRQPEYSDRPEKQHQPLA